MTDVVPIFDEGDGFIGVWASNRGLEPTMGSLAALMSLAEPTLKALTAAPCERTNNYGVVRVGDNISFRDGVFLMVGQHDSPPAAVKNGRSFVAISYHGVPIAKRRPVPLKFARRWWRIWK